MQGPLTGFPVTLSHHYDSQAIFPKELHACTRRNTNNTVRGINCQARVTLILREVEHAVTARSLVAQALEGRDIAGDLT